MIIFNRYFSIRIVFNSSSFFFAVIILSNIIFSICIIIASISMHIIVFPATNVIASVVEDTAIWNNFETWIHSFSLIAGGLVLYSSWLNSNSSQTILLLSVCRSRMKDSYKFMKSEIVNNFDFYWSEIIWKCSLQTFTLR